MPPGLSKGAMSACHAAAASILSRSATERRCWNSFIKEVASCTLSGRITNSLNADLSSFFRTIVALDFGPSAGKVLHFPRAARKSEAAAP